VDTPIGQTIRILRQARQMKLNELARLARISSPFLSLVETGQRQPSVAVLQRISHALGIPRDLLVLLATGVDTSLRGNKASKSIARSVNRMIDIERRLREVLESEDSTNATKHRRAK
jgi:transcriptional regulator with XRE-family HTH domain